MTEKSKALCASAVLMATPPHRMDYYVASAFLGLLSILFLAAAVRESK